ncbi:MAG: ABC transporter permease subunit [Nocardioides sp.]|uniref:ABC transporter permease n=1 Tax=Nocardioides sp. TaxID=35761 RepID=UPI0039E5AF8B
MAASVTEPTAPAPRPAVRGHGRVRRAGGGVNLLGLGVIVVLVVAWQLLVGAGVVNEDALPTPTDIWHGFRYLAGKDGGLWEAVRHTVGVVLLAWAIGAVLGGLLGVVLTLNRGVASWTNATVDLLRSLPVVAFIPIAIIVWGTGSKTEIVLGAYSALWPMLINTAGGVRDIPPRLHDVARTMRLSPLAKLTKVILPATGSAMLVGARLSLAATLVICVVAEMLGLQSGIGNQLVLEQSANQPARMWVYVLTTGVLGIGVNFGLVWLFRLVLPGVAAVAERRAG